jgi:hypothetical protein
MIVFFSSRMQNYEIYFIPSKISLLCLNTPDGYGMVMSEIACLIIYKVAFNLKMIIFALKFNRNKHAYSKSNYRKYAGSN